MSMDRDELLRELAGLYQNAMTGHWIPVKVSQDILKRVDAHLHAAPQPDMEEIAGPMVNVFVPMTQKEPQQFNPNGAAPLNEKAAIKLCNEDGKPCPPPIAGKGRGDSRCEQNGLCQRTSIENAPRLHVTVDDSGGLELSVAPAAPANLNEGTFELPCDYHPIALNHDTEHEQRWPNAVTPPPDAGLSEERIQKLSDLVSRNYFQVGNKKALSELCADAIRQALSSRGERKDVPIEGPVAWIEHHKGGDNLCWDNPGIPSTPLYMLAAAGGKEGEV